MSWTVCKRAFSSLHASVSGYVTVGERSVNLCRCRFTTVCVCVCDTGRKNDQFLKLNMVCTEGQ